jgi:hypothetical protein
MTELAGFIATRAIATPIVSVSWMTTAMNHVRGEIEHRTRGDAIGSETDIWNALLKRICGEAEEQVGEFCRTRVLSAVSNLGDREAVSGLDIVGIRDTIFAEAQVQFRRQCTDRRADFLTLVPELTAAAEHRLRARIETDLHDYRERLRYLLDRREAALLEAETQAIRAIDVLNGDDILSFNIVKARSEISQQVKTRFTAEVQAGAEIMRDFPNQGQQFKKDLGYRVEELLTSRHARPFTQAVVREMFPIGTIVSIMGETPPAWMNTDWERLLEGRVLVSSGSQDGQFPNGGTGGEANHSHPTGPHVLTVEEIPPHAHPIRNVSEASRFRVCQQAAHCPVYLPSGVGASDSIGGGAAHDHGRTGQTSSYSPYVCASFWKRVR